MELPTLADVTKMDLTDLVICAENMGIEGCEDFETDDEYREAILQRLPSVPQASESSTPPVSLI
jgi:hypothetical protein